MRIGSRLLVWSGLLAFCILCWMWVVGMILDAFADDEPQKPPRWQAIKALDIEARTR